jgi:hypothetical protein
MVNCYRVARESLYEVRNVMRTIANSRMPVDRWPAASRGCRPVVTKSIPITICTETAMAAMAAVFLAGFRFFAE